MNSLNLALEIIQAIGAIATAVSVILLLTKLSKKLKVSGEMPIKNSNEYLVSIYNNTPYDNEITSIQFWKGNPIGAFSSSPSLFFLVDLSYTGQLINENTQNIILPKDSYVDIPIPCCDIALHYEKIGEAIGKPYDTIYILIRDRRGHKYCINTHYNVDMFRLGQQSR